MDIHMTIVETNKIVQIGIANIVHIVNAEDIRLMNADPDKDVQTHDNHHRTIHVTNVGQINILGKIVHTDIL